MVAREPVRLLEKRVYKSYLARLRASKRLGARLAVWNITLTTASTALLIVTIAQLAFGQTSTRDMVLVVAVSAILLSLTLVITSLNYGARAERMIANYRALQALSVEIEAATHTHWIKRSDYESWVSRYNVLLDASENHSPADHLGSGLSNARDLFTVAGSAVATYLPLAGLVIALGVLAGLFLTT